MTLSVQNGMGFDSDLIIIHYTWLNFNVRGLNFAIFIILNVLLHVSRLIGWTQITIIYITNNDNMNFFFCSE